MTNQNSNVDQESDKESTKDYNTQNKEIISLTTRKPGSNIKPNLSCDLFLSTFPS